MNYNDIILTNMLFNSITKINTGYIIIDAVYILILSSLMFYFFHPNFKNKIGRKIESIFHRLDNTNRLIFNTSDKMTSKRFKGIMHFVSKTNDPSIKVLTEVIDVKYNYREEPYEESKTSIYRVDQSTIFRIDKDIDGKVYYKEKEISEFSGKVNYIKLTFLEIFSKKLTLTQLEDWVEKKTQDYDSYIRSKSCDKQLLVDVCWDPREKEVSVYNNVWASNATFENRFFTDKDKILNKINFFINNPEWYKKRGIPYTLGFLLWGEPGCGKTGFIKALMNLTGRHGISIKLNNRFDMNKLRDIIYDDEIADDLIIPQENRILIFEDVDCMGDMVQDRTIKEREKSKYDDEDEMKPKQKRRTRKDDEDDLVIIDNNYNNNLSYFLNILDGLQECPGRIIIMTTNKPEQLDKALIRPGRIDYNINFTKATIEDVKNILEHYWCEDIDNQEINGYTNYTFSHAEIVNFCRISETLDESIQKILLTKPKSNDDYVISE